MEDIYGFHQPKSVDWVLFPAAGGGIEAWESEGEAVIDWESITEADIQKNLPSLWAKWHPENHGQPGVHGSSQEGEEEEEDDQPAQTKKTPKKKGTDQFVAREEVASIVAEALTAHDKEREKIEEKQRLAADQVREAFAGSGLPPVTQKRLIASYEGIEEFDKTKVEKDIADAKEELKAAGAGPVITGMGPSGGAGEGTGDQTPTYSVKESVESHFAGPKKSAKSDDSHDDKKES